MNILSVHNRYIQPGGEDQVFESEAKLLAQKGWNITPLCLQNTYPEGIVKKLGVAANCIWSRKSYRDFAKLLGELRPDVVHVHNFFPLVSPSLYYACRKARVPVVQTLHNYRLLCPSATFYRDGRVCEECLHHNLLRSVRYGCYQGSKAGTAALAVMLQTHRQMGTWNKMVDCYIALTEFARVKFIAGGLPAEKIRVKPNFVLPDPGPRHEQGDYALFVGRLVDPKGVHTLVSAWKGLQIPLHIVGDGPYREQLERDLQQEGMSAITYRGRLPHDETLQAMRGARFLVFPSEWYEGFPMTIVEAFASGVPVICCRLGAMQEVVADGRTGLHYRTGEANDLAAKVCWAWEHPAEVAVMGQNARDEFEAKYTADRNFEMMRDIYQSVISSCHGTADQHQPEVVAV